MGHRFQLDSCHSSRMDLEPRICPRVDEAEFLTEERQGTVPFSCQDQRPITYRLGLTQSPG